MPLIVLGASGRSNTESGETPAQYLAQKFGAPPAGLEKYLTVILDVFQHLCSSTLIIALVPSRHCDGRFEHWLELGPNLKSYFT